MARDSKYLFGLISTIAVVLFAKIVMVVLFVYLPKVGVSLEPKYNFAATYVRVDFGKLFGAKKVQSKPTTQQHSTQISELVLKGLYGNAKKGFVVVAKRSNEKATSIVSMGESYDGYTLRFVGSGYALFEKNAKEYKLSLQEAKKVLQQNNVTFSKEENNEHTVHRGDINYFAKNPAEIWKNISIVDYKEGGELIGFKVRWIKKGSKFAQLGLKKGDIIIKVNNKALHSYKDALDIYAKVAKLKELMLIVLRDGEEKEILYEVH